MRILLIITATILICMLAGSLGWLVIYEIKKPINMLIEKFIEWYLRRIKNETRQLRELQTQLENNKNVSFKVKGYVKERFSANYVLVSLFVASVAAILLIVAAVISSKCFDFYIDNKDVVLTFVGIIATFIVVTNYAQVIEIKHQFSERAKETEGNLKSSITESKGEFNKNINKIASSIKELDNEKGKQAKELYLKNLAFVITYHNDKMRQLAEDIVNRMCSDTYVFDNVTYLDDNNQQHTVGNVSFLLDHSQLNVSINARRDKILKINDIDVPDLSKLEILIDGLLMLKRKQ